MSLVDSLLRTLDFSPRGQVIAREADAWGEIIVSDHKDYRTLRFDGICEQSKMSLSNPTQPIHNYIKAMLMAVAWQPIKNFYLFDFLTEEYIHLNFYRQVNRIIFNPLISQFTRNSL